MSFTISNRLLLSPNVYVSQIAVIQTSPNTSLRAAVTGQPETDVSIG